MSEQATEQTTSGNTTDSTTTSEAATTDQTTGNSQDTQTAEQSSSIAGAIAEGGNAKDETSSSNTNTGDDNASDGDANQTTETQTAEVNEDYELELNDESPLTQEELDAIAEYASENNLSKEQAEQVIANREALVSQGLNIAQTKQIEHYKQLNDSFNKDPEFSGDKRVESFAAIQKAVNTFGDDNLVEALKDPVIGNNIALGKFLKKIGDMISPEGFEGMKPNKGGVDISDNSREGRMKRLYPEHFQEK